MKPIPMPSDCQTLRLCLLSAVMYATKSCFASCSFLYFSFCSSNSAFFLSSSRFNSSSYLSLSFRNLLSSINCHFDSFYIAIFELSVSIEALTSKFEARAVRCVTSPSLILSHLNTSSLSKSKVKVIYERSIAKSAWGIFFS